MTKTPQPQPQHRVVCSTTCHLARFIRNIEIGEEVKILFGPAPK